MAYSTFTGQLSKQYGIPSEVLDSAIYIDGSGDQASATQIAEGLRNAYEKSGGDWSKAVDTFSAARYRGDFAATAAAIKDTAGLSKPNSSFLDKLSKLNPFGAASDAFKFGSAVGSGDSEAVSTFQKYAGGGFVVVFGAVLIVLAIVSAKPVQSAIVKAVAK